jgi:hypothetical protein
MVYQYELSTKHQTSGGSEKTNSSLANATSSNAQIIKQPDGSYQVYGVRKLASTTFRAIHFL